MSTTRRTFLQSGAALAAVAAAPRVLTAAPAPAKPAILGGTPVHQGGWQE